MKIKQAIILGLIILGGALSLRLFNLNSLPVFADEAIYVRWSQVMRSESTLRFLPLSDGKQPLYMWVTVPFLKVVANPLLAARILSVLCGVVTVAGIGVLTWLLTNNLRQSIVASAISSVIPYFVFFDRMALADSMLNMWLVLTYVLTLLSVRYKRWDMSMLAGFTLGFAWLTKSPAIFALVLLPLTWITARWNLKTLGYLLTTYVIGFGLYNILRLGPEFHMIALRNKDYVFSFPEVLQHPFNPLIPHLKDTALFYWYLFTPLPVLFAIWGAVIGYKKTLGVRLVLLLWWLVPIFAQAAIAKQFTARYLMFTVPFAVILASFAFEQIGDKTRRHMLTWASLGLTVISAAVFSFVLIFSPQQAWLPRIERSGYLEEWTAGFGIEEISKDIINYANSGPVVVGSEGFFGTPFDGLQMYLNKQPNVRVVGIGVGENKIDPKLLSAAAENRTFWVVNSSRFSADPDKLGLELISAYPKAFRPDGTRESLLLFEVKKP